MGPVKSVSFTLQLYMFLTHISRIRNAAFIHLCILRSCIFRLPSHFLRLDFSFNAGATNKPQELDDAVLRRLVSMLLSDSFKTFLCALNNNVILLIPV